MEDSDKPIFQDWFILYLIVLAGAGKNRELLGMSVSLARIGAISILFLSLIGALSGRSTIPLSIAHATDPTISTVYVTPVQTCCVMPNATIPTFTVNVMMNLTASDQYGTNYFSGFDVRLNYTHWFAPAEGSGVVKAVSIDYSDNVFTGTNFATSAACIDDVTYGDGICATDDMPGGQVHLAQSLLGTTLQGPLMKKLLFSVKFTVNGTGTSVFYLDRANLVNPGNTAPFKPRYIQVVTSAAVFGNNPLVAFFDYSPTGGIASVVSGKNVFFNAGNSFRVGVSGSSTTMNLTNPHFSWSFGDGTPPLTVTVPTLMHQFARPGNYTVQLSVTDGFPGGGFIQRTIQVFPPLGGLYVTVRNQDGGSITSIVNVQVHNFTNPEPPLCKACNGTLSAGGIVQFRNLSPGIYTMTLSGPGVEPENQQTTIYEGWTTQETVYLTEKPTPQINNLPLIIFGGLVGGGLLLAIVGLTFKRVSARRTNGGKRKKPLGPTEMGRKARRHL